MDPNPYAPGIQPLISLPQFHFTPAFAIYFVHGSRGHGLCRRDGIDIPPSSSGGGIQAHEFRRQKSVSRSGQIRLRRYKVAHNTAKPGKPPLEFDIGDLKMKILAGIAMRFDATLVNPKPVEYSVDRPVRSV